MQLSCFCNLLKKLARAMSEAVVFDCLQNSGNRKLRWCRRCFWQAEKGTRVALYVPVLALSASCFTLLAYVINRSSQEYASFIQICKNHGKLLGVV